MSYFPCDEGLYKKKYLDGAECGHIAGMEMLIDDVIPSAIEDHLTFKPDDMTDLIETLEEDHDVDLEFLRSISYQNLCPFVNALMKHAAEEIEHICECERGETLVAFIDDKYSGKSDKELEPYWDKSSRDEYTDKDPLEDEDFTFNSNGKPRPVWSKENSWQVDEGKNRE